MSLNFFLVTKVFVCSAILTLCLGIAELVKGGTGIGAAVCPPHRRPEPEQRSLPGPRPVLELPEELGGWEGLVVKLRFRIAQKRSKSGDS